MSSGGVALNCVANGKLLEEKIFDDIWIQPASGDAGSSLGGALIAWHEFFNQPRKVNEDDSMKDLSRLSVFQQGNYQLFK